ncbi:MAG: hypothetical protein WD844_11110 [Thermoleophilaceae bacterium]
MDACSLTKPQLSERLLAFAELPLLDGRLRFGGEPGVEERLRELIRLENACCPAAGLTLERDGDALVLAIEA